MAGIGVIRSSLGLLSAVVFVGFALSPATRHFDVSEYLYGIDNDLQARAHAAIEAERFAYQSKSWKLDVENPADDPCENRITQVCPPSKYRTPSGACNNVRHPAWGARGSPFLKFLPPAYSDGIASPRQSVSSHTLPPSIEVAAKVLKSEEKQASETHEALTSVVGSWSLLLLRDIASTPYVQHALNRCCHEANSHPECYDIREEDGRCNAYIRSVPTRSAHTCRFHHREQMNAASAFLDLSDFYGATDDEIHKSMEYWYGYRDYDFKKVTKKYNASARHEDFMEYHLSVFYEMFMLEHERLLVGLTELNEHWDRSRVFLETRRIIVAMVQHITFNEYLPTILGEAALADPELRPVSNGYYWGYSSTNRAGTYDAAGLAALKALIAMVNYDLTALTNPLPGNKLPAQTLRLRNAFNHGKKNEVLEYARYVHMGRDHGLPGYVEFVANCSGNPKVKTFAELEELMPEKKVKLLESIYSNVEDVDLILGGLLENPINGGAVGPTFACILRQQFVKLRNSDRFWYENDIQPTTFSPAQLAEIRKVTLAHFLCRNSGITEVQPNVFLQRDEYLNAELYCVKYRSMDLTPWLEKSEPLEMTNDLVTESPKASRRIDFDVDPELIDYAIREAQNAMLYREKLQYDAFLKNKFVDPRSPAGTAASFSKANKAALQIANSSLLLELTTNHLLNGPQGLRRRKRQVFDNTNNVLGFPNNDFSDLLQNIDISGFLPRKKPTNHEEVDCAPDDGPCDPTTPYRTLSGYCNNLRNPNLGKSLTTFARLLPPAYEDGVSKPRSTSVTGVPLPNPRVVSTVIHPDISNLHNRYTLMVMQFAQFLDHDLTMTPIHKGFAESIPSCRSCDSPRTVHPECSPIPIPPGDHFYPTVNVTSGSRMCFPSMRSLPGQQTLGPREQINQNTGFLDASVVYGENVCISNVLRGFSGRMNITAHPARGKDLLPQSATHPECKAPSGYCFIGGDGRASEQPALTVMHTMWIREHNRIMEGLRQVNPHWDAEKLYQETRRIISGMLQHITYNEFLPRILGWNAVSLYGLKLLPQGYYKEYSPTCNPSVLNEFATAAYRIGHSMLRPHIPRMDRNYHNVDPPILLRDGFFNPDMLYQQEMVDEMIRGLVSTPMETLDQFITGEVTNHLFEQKNIPHSGVDLIALNVHRARDHGIPSYNNYRALCNLKRATTFEDLSREMAPEVIARLKRIYASVDDIDLFPGGMSERPLQGGLVGPTFACIIAIQFRQSRKCDRFWYETDDPNIRFTEHQLAEVRKTTLSKVICENMDHHQDMQRAAFDLPSNFLNPRVPCNSMPHMDFSAWRETRHGCQIGGRNVAVGDTGFPTPCTSCVCTAEGTKCASLRVTDCNQLLREASREAILQDDVCTAQCGFVLAATEATASLQQFTTPNSFPGFPMLRNGLRSASASSVSFNGFKLPDLSQFIG